MDQHDRYDEFYRTVESGRAKVRAAQSAESAAALSLALNRMISESRGQFEHPRDQRAPQVQKLLNPGGAESARIRRSYIDTIRDRFLDRS